MRNSSTHVDAGGVKRALVGDVRGRAHGAVAEAAVREQAASFVDDPLHQGHGQAQQGGQCNETSQEAEDQQDPFLQRQCGSAVEREHLALYWWCVDSKWRSLEGVWGEGGIKS